MGSGHCIEKWKKRNLIGEDYSKIKVNPPAKFISNINYFENFKNFLDEKKINNLSFSGLGG